MEVQIIHYIQDHSFNDRYHQTSGPELHFKTFKIGPTRDYKIARKGAKTSIEYYGRRWTHITGLIPIRDGCNLYCGDINGETVGIWIDPDGSCISMAMIKGHRAKRKGTRIKAVTNLINNLKK